MNPRILRRLGSPKAFWTLLLLLPCLAVLIHIVRNYVLVPYSDPANWLAYARTGSYDPIWWAGIALALLAAALSWPIDERPLARRAAGVARSEA